MQLSIGTRDGIRIVAISGQIDLHATGPLLDALVDALGDEDEKLIVDLSDVVRLTSIGMRGLVVAATLSRSAHRCPFSPYWLSE